jgi:hypothetical protein
VHCLQILNGKATVVAGDGVCDEKGEWTDGGEATKCKLSPGAKLAVAANKLYITDRVRQ